MRHLNRGGKLGVNPAHRRAIIRNLVTALFTYGRVRTTETRAKELRRYAERLVTLGKSAPESSLAGLEGDALVKAKARRVHAMRQARTWVLDRDALQRLFGEFADRYQARPGGYTRILKLSPRKGDNAEMALIELVDHPRADFTPVDDAPEMESSSEAVAAE